MPGFRSWGGYAELVAVDNADFNLVTLPDEIDFVSGAGMGCRFMTAFHGLTDRAPVRAGDWVVVYGCGGVGLSAVEIATALGAQVIGVDIGADKLELAREVGAIAVVNSAEVTDPAEAVIDITDGGAHLSVDALGIAATCRDAIRSLRKRGRHVQIGMTTGEQGGDLPVPIDHIIGHEIQLSGSKGMPPAHYDAMLRLVAAGRLNPGRLVSRTVPLEEASDVLASMGGYDTVGFTVIDRY
jgi:alcohol dehydrogenase/propanol-preferring alcohol dehydrogenase